MKKFLASVFKGAQLANLLRDLGLTALSSFLTEVGPLSFTPGLANVSGNQWMTALNHTAAVVVVTLSALVGTPLTRRYGVGAATPETPTVPSP